MAEAPSVLRKLGKPSTGTEAEVLEEYRTILLQQDNGKYDMAKWRLQKSLEERSKKLAGL